MFNRQLQAFNSTTPMFIQAGKRGYMPRRVLFMLLATLAASFIQISFYQPETYAATLNADYTCARYTILPGDTLSAIAAKRHVNILTLSRANRITNMNLIFAGNSLCIPLSENRQSYGSYSSGILPNGSVRWYAYNALEGSTYYQVDAIVHRAAAYYGLSANLVRALAQQESGLQQHVISSDGGIGVMQLMPTTASWINSMTGTERDPYKLQDNIFMGAFYVRLLGDTFHWDSVKMISAYNEGPWAVTHHGVFNWSYVNNVISMINNPR